MWGEIKPSRKSHWKCFVGFWPIISGGQDSTGQESDYWTSDHHCKMMLCALKLAPVQRNGQVILCGELKCTRLAFGSSKWVRSTYNTLPPLHIYIYIYICFFSFFYFSFILYMNDSNLYNMSLPVIVQKTLLRESQHVMCCKQGAVFATA